MNTRQMRYEPLPASVLVALVWPVNFRGHGFLASFIIDFKWALTAVTYERSASVIFSAACGSQKKSNGFPGVAEI